VNLIDEFLQTVFACDRKSPEARLNFRSESTESAQQATSYHVQKPFDDISNVWPVKKSAKISRQKYERCGAVNSHNNLHFMKRNPKPIYEI